jgi:hypothetical protein
LFKFQDFSISDFSDRLAPTPLCLNRKKFARERTLWQNFRRMIHKRLCWLSLMVAGLFAGCGKSDPLSSDSSRSSQPSTLNSQPSLRLHWLGKKQLAADTNAAPLWNIWRLPESVRLEAQTLDKLAAAPWRFWQTNSAVSNAPTALLRPLLNDLLQEECYLEVRTGTNQPTELVLAVRQPADRAALWQTNLPLVWASIFGSASNQPATRNPQPTLTHSNDWTLLSLTGPRPATLDPRPSLLADFQQRLATNNAPFPPRLTNYWVEMDFDFRVLAPVVPGIGGGFTNRPHMSLRLLGDGQNVRTSGEFKFSQALKLALEPWQIPTNFICDPLVSFTAVRGVKDWIASRAEWSESKLGPSPNQVFFWAQSPALWQHFLTYPVTSASNHVTALGDWILQELNPIFQTNRVGGFAWSTNKFGLVWQGLPFFKPVIEPARFAQSDYALIGLFANNATNRAVPPALFAEFENRTNLVYYDWEISSPQVTSWTQMGQLLRMVFGRRQLSPATASLPWLKAITPSLGNATTILVLDDPQQVSLRRTASLGLTAVELHLLADWLESPDFPRGFYTLLAPRVVLRPVPEDLNALPRRSP